MSEMLGYNPYEETEHGIPAKSEAWEVPQNVVHLIEMVVDTQLNHIQLLDKQNGTMAIGDDLLVALKKKWVQVGKDLYLESLVDGPKELDDLEHHLSVEEAIHNLQAMIQKELTLDSINPMTIQ